MNHYWLFLTPDGSVVEIDADNPLWNKRLSIYEKLMLQNDERVFLRIGDDNVECILLKQGTKTDLIAKKESLLKNASLSPLVLSEIASTSNVLDVSITAENAREHSPNPECQTPLPGSKSTCRRADSSATCGRTSSSSFSQSLSSEPTPSKVRRKTVLQCCKNHIDLAEVFRQSEEQLASLLTKYEDVMQSQNDDLEEQIASLKLLLKAALGRQKEESEDEFDSELEEPVASDTIFYNGKNLEKGYIGSDEEKYGRYLRVAIWGNQGLTDCMIDPERNDGRPPADAEGVDVFRRAIQKRFPPPHFKNSFLKARRAANKAGKDASSNRKKSK